MSALRLTVWTIVLCLVHDTRASTCPGPNQESTVKLTLNSHQNRTGHWQVQVDLQQTGGVGETNGNPWSLDLHRRTTTSCTGEVTAAISLVANLTTTQHTSTSPVTAQPNQTAVESSPQRYKIHDAMLSWPEAQKLCAREGMQLVLLDSANENDVVSQFPLMYPFVWTGVYKKGGKYWTESGAELNVKKMAWSPGEPNDPAPDNCVSMYTANGLLADSQCVSKLSVVCEVK